MTNDHDHGRAALADALAGLLGPRAALSVADVRTAAEVETELLASHDAAEPDEWALVRRAWPVDAVQECVDTLHRIGRNVGTRDVWLSVPGRTPRAVAVESDAVLDNPIGFAGLAEAGRSELRLLDRDVAAGLRLVRGPSGWQLAVWGEPWLSATTRALRGIG